ncbi:MAG: hypothetical protein HKP60_07745 [Eudoraea sp.]|nr:hypothetical protein [Eudoraea sp.]NNJ40743.1 hypothetical protein [Eudoraea sp.]
MTRVGLSLLLFLAILWSSCRKDFDFEVSNGQLEFSRDTVFLDTVFTGISSSTYSLKVYNPTDDDLSIPFVGLADGGSSGYRLNVDGESGKIFSDVPILARDSLYVFIETTLDINSLNQNEFLYTDAIRFGTGNSIQEVQLVTLIRDAVFLYPSTQADGTRETLSLGTNPDGTEVVVQGFFLQNDELNFTNEKPYVIYGYAAVANGQTLAMAPGTRVHFHKDSGIWVGPGASLQINGSLSTDRDLLENEVILEGDRLEPEFSEVPGQWGTLWLAAGSTNNAFNYLTLKNATVGILAEGNPGAVPPTLLLANCQVYNSSLVNLWGRNSSIYGENLVLGNAGNASFYGNLGGDYEFLHSTFANYWSNGFRTGSAIQLNNFEESINLPSQAADLTQAYFGNCIISGNTSTELFLNSNGENLFNFNFEHCLIKFEQPSADPLYDFGNTANYTNILLNGDASFLDLVEQDFRISENSDAIGNGKPEAAQRVPFDLLGTDRTTLPDIGAFQYVPQE